MEEEDSFVYQQLHFTSPQLLFSDFMLVIIFCFPTMLHFITDFLLLFLCGRTNGPQTEKICHHFYSHQKHLTWTVTLSSGQTSADKHTTKYKQYSDKGVKTKVSVSVSWLPEKVGWFWPRCSVLTNSNQPLCFLRKREESSEKRNQRMTVTDSTWE